MATIIETNHKANSIAINLPIIVSEYWLYRQMCRLIFKYIYYFAFNDFSLLPSVFTKSFKHRLYYRFKD